VDNSGDGRGRLRASSKSPRFRYRGVAASGINGQAKRPAQPFMRAQDGNPMPFKCTVPAVPTVQRDDDAVRITRWDFEPGAATGWHSHGWPYFVVMLTDALMRVDDGAAVQEIQRKAGDTYNRKAGVEHDVMNGSDAPMAFIEIEIKRAEGIV
jgi:beta-alanine degradation protein BauB